MVIIQVKRDTPAEWVSANPVLKAGEFGYEIGTGNIKIGDGSTNWNSLNYVYPSNSSDNLQHTDIGDRVQAYSAKLDDYITNGPANAVDIIDEGTAASRYLRYDADQTLTTEEKERVRDNIGAAAYAESGDALVDADIGVTVQGYNAKLQDYAQNGPSSVDDLVLDSEITDVLRNTHLGTTVQGYSVKLNDYAQNGPSSVGDLVTESEADVRYLRFDQVQIIDPIDQALARGNISAASVDALPDLSGLQNNAAILDALATAFASNPSAPAAAVVLADGSVRVVYTGWADVADAEETTGQGDYVFDLSTANATNYRLAASNNGALLKPSNDWVDGQRGSILVTGHDTNKVVASNDWTVDWVNGDTSGLTGLNAELSNLVAGTKGRLAYEVEGANFYLSYLGKVGA